jgi:hypothetical protein
MEIREVSLIPLRGTELLKEGDLEYNNFGKVMKLPAASGGVSSGIPPKQTRLRSMSFGAVRLAIHPCGKPQGILAKANKVMNVPLYMGIRSIRLSNGVWE